MRSRELLLQAIKLGLLSYGAVTHERRTGVTILVYHRVGGGSIKELDLPTDLFDWQMRFLRQHFAVVGLDDIAARAQTRPHGTRDAVVITFDDGYEDVYHHAFPVLARYRLPATIYLATSYLEDRRPFAFEMSLREAQRGWPLTWNQAREMARSGLVTIGAHTHTHPDMAQLTPREIEQELEASNRLIAERLGKAPVHFAYPWGRTTGAAKRVVDRVYQTAVIGGTRKNPYGQIDPHALMRTPIQRSDGRFFFRCKLGSYLHGEEWVRAVADGRRRARPAPDVEAPMSS